MTPLEQLLAHAKAQKEKGIKVVSVEYIISKFEQEKAMYALERVEGA